MLMLIKKSDYAIRMFVISNNFLFIVYISDGRPTKYLKILNTMMQQ